MRDPASPGRRRLWAFGFLCLVAAACTSPQGEVSPSSAGCAPDTDPALGRPIEAGRIDQRLFDAALVSAVNAERCARGLRPLARDPALARAASAHSADMAEFGFFDHVSPVPGRRRLADRFDQAGVAYRRASENIATTGLYAFDNRRFIVRDAANCDFAFSIDGPPIPRHSYASAADAFLRVWLGSPGHRRNLLDPAATRHGGGVAFEPDRRFCGDLVATQNFAG